MDAVNDPLIHTVVIMSSAQIGKALSIDTPIATPNGWSTMGELSVGDRVFGRNGQAITVTLTSSIMFDRPCFKVCFSDKSEIVADADHKWSVYKACKWGGKNKSAIATTVEMFSDFKNGNRNRYSIDVCSPLQLPTVSLPLDPYFLGVWLGDGHSSSASISVGRQDIKFMEKELRSIYPEFSVGKDKSCFSIKYRRKHMKRCLRGHETAVFGVNSIGTCKVCFRQMSKTNMYPHLGNRVDPIINKTMHGRLSELGLIKNKHIPEVFLRCSYSQRLSLFQGLMDTDGHIGSNGRCEFVTTHSPLGSGFAELLASLGIKYTSRQIQPKTKYKGQVVFGKLATRFSFLVYEDKNVFRLPRKLIRLASRKGARINETERRRIVNIEKVTSTPVKCIQVNSADHLYLAGKTMIPTHNTEAINCIVGYYIAEDPSPILVLQPTIEMANAWSVDRLAPMLRDTPALQDKVKQAKTKDSGNTKLHKIFPGGHITMAGANSPASLASRPIRIILCDEVDRYSASAGAEGDPIDLAFKRSTTFWNRKHVLTSTPTIKGFSRIEKAYNESDQRKYYVPCPECQEYQVLMWAQVTWSKDQPETAYYQCEFCGAVLDDRDKIAMVRQGEWRATAKSNGIAGFWLNELSSPWVTFGKMAGDFVNAKRNGPETLKVFVNTSLGETWEDDGVKINDEALYARRENYGPKIPKDAGVLTAGVDIQGDRVEVEVVAWGKSEESWNIDHKVFYGNPQIYPSPVWDDLDAFLARVWTHESGAGLNVACVCVDSGAYTVAVYGFVKERQGRRVFATKGVGGEGHPLLSRPTINKQHRVKLFKIGVDAAKDSLFSRLTLEEPGPGFCHFPMERDEEFFKQLNSEKKITKHVKGRPKFEYRKTRDRNEALDLRIMATSALTILNANLNLIVDNLNVDETESGAKQEKSGQKTEEHPFFQKKTARKAPKRINFAKNIW